MKKTIATIAILAAGSVALSMPRPPDPNAPRPVLKTICLKTYTRDDGSASLANCDSSSNNKRARAELKENGCAEGQSSITTYNNLAIASCMPPGMVQL